MPPDSPFIHGLVAARQASDAIELFAQAARTPEVLEQVWAINSALDEFSRRARENSRVRFIADLDGILCLIELGVLRWCDFPHDLVNRLEESLGRGEEAASGDTSVHGLRQGV